MFSQRGVLNLAHNEHDVKEIRRRVSANKLNGIDQKKIKFVLRLLGGKISKARERLSELPVEVIENLEDAVSKAVSMSK